MIISFIVAKARNGAIGKDNKLPWHLPADMKLFKQLTMGHHLIMGRETFESMGKPLPGRTSIVLTRNTQYKAEGCLIVHSISESLIRAEESGEKEVFILGGAEIFQQFLNKADKIYLTEIDADIDGDTFFPELDDNKWKETKRIEFLPDDKNVYPYAFVELIKTKP